MHGRGLGKIREYFSTLESTIPKGQAVTSIYQLTIDMAYKAGYKREPYKLKNGCIRERASYTRRFDDVMTAMWICFYKPLFVGNLSKHPKLREYYVWIINDTFLKVMANIDFSILTCDKALTCYVKKVFRSVLYDKISLFGSLEKSEYNKRIAKKRAVNVDVAPLGDIDSLKGWQFFTCLNTCYGKDTELDGIELDLKIRLRGSEMGSRLLSYLINSRGKVNTKKIDDLVYLSVDEKTQENLDELKRAYKIIRDTVMEYVGFDRHPYCGWKKLPQISFSDGEQRC